MSAVNIYRCGPRQIRELATDALMAGLVPNIESSPGMGKSSIVRAIAKEYGLFVIDHRLSTSAPEDLTGLPRITDNDAKFVPFRELFPTEDMTPPPGYQGWLLFFDEFNSGSKEVIAAAYKIILDKMVGQHRLHPAVAMACAGNLATDRAIVNNLGTAMQSRLVHLEMQIVYKEWLEDVAIPEGYDARVIAYLQEHPSKLMDFRPDHNDKTFCCPRTWSFMNRLMLGKQFKMSERDGQTFYEMDRKIPLYAGTITSGVATDFVQFTKVFLSMISIKEILADPMNAAIPNDRITRWAVIGRMMEQVTEQNFGDLCVYANRFGLDFQVLFFRSVLARNMKLVKHPAFTEAAIRLAKYLE